MRGHEPFVDAEGRVRAHVWLSGVVQGVGFRAAVQRRARELGLTGWVRNLPDGRVELVAEGDVPRVEALLDFCRVGPRGAHVTGMEVEYEHPAGDLMAFRIVG